MNILSICTFQYMNIHNSLTSIRRKSYLKSQLGTGINGSSVIPPCLKKNPYAMHAQSIRDDNIFLFYVQERKKRKSLRRSSKS